MKTPIQNTSKSQLLKRILILVVAGTVLVMSSAFNTQVLKDNELSLAKEIESNLKLNKGSYYASEFLKFKRENLRDDLFTEKQVSEKVLFRAFVSSEKRKQLH